MQKYIVLILVAVLTAACSTTSNLPPDELLYTGIESITYADNPAEARKKGGRDSVGVITAVGEAAQAVEAALTGKGFEALADKMPENRELTKEERKAVKLAQEKAEADFEAAKTEVEAVLAYPPNNALFGSSSISSPLQIGLWVHNAFANSNSLFAKWINKSFGTQPVLISSVSPEMRAKVATNTLHNYGYFHGRVDYGILPQKNPKKARVNYNVRAGQLYRLDSIEYRNFPLAIDTLLRQHHKERLLKRGDAFSVINLSAEQTRIENILRENGFYYYTAPLTTFKADTLMRKNFVQLRVEPQSGLSAKAQKPWYVGRVYVILRDKPGASLDSTLTRRNYTYRFSGKKLPLRPVLWRHAITHRKGERFSLTDQRMTLEKLGQLGVFSQMDVNYVPRDTSAAGDTLDILVTAVMDKLYDSSLELGATLKSNQQVGPGISYELAKRNAFRGAEKVSFKIFGSYEWQTGAGAQGGNSLLNSYELGSRLALNFPRFVFPGVSRRRVRFPASTVFSLDADWKNRSGFFNIMSFGLSATYQWNKRPRAHHSLTLFSLEYDKMLHTTATFDSIMNANPALSVSMRNQFIPSLSYTFTFTSAAHHRNPVWFQGTIKEAGNFTSGVYAIFGKKFSTLNKELFGNPFAQYIKATAELHHTIKFSDRLKLATRVFGGVIYSYGNSTTPPYVDQFYVGGANSVRAFTVRSLGPGTYKANESKYAYIDQTGDIKLEANAELRARLIGNLHGAVFLDAGNVWLMRDDPQRPGAKFTPQNLKNVALGTGLGIRYDLDFLVLRFDVGVALHAPYETAKSGFYNIEKFKDGLGFHFAVGYPF